MTIEELQERRQRSGITCEEIAYLSRIPVETVRKVFDGELDSDEVDLDEKVLDLLELVFEVSEREAEAEKKGEYERKKDADLVREAQTAYQVKKWQGEYTVEDYWAVPEEEHVELIDGVLYDMAPPVSIHQKLSFLIGKAIDAFIEKKGGLCVMFAAPVGTQLDCDDKTMLEPDITVVCDRSKLQRGIIYGAPDLVIEVLSKSTEKRDRTVKKEKYQNAGVREYWMVDPKKKRIQVYHFEKEDFSRIYSFEDQVPIGIFDGECKVDFVEIYRKVEFLYENQKCSG